MRFIWVHTLMQLLSLFDTLSSSLYFCLAFFSMSLIGVDWRGGFSSHKVYTCLMVRLVSAHWVVLFHKGNSNTLDIFLKWILSRVQYRQSLEGSAPFLRGLWLSISPTFLERVPRLSENLFLIVPAWSRSFVLFYFLGGFRSCHWVLDSLTAPLAMLLRDLACPLFTGFLRGYPKFSEGLLLSYKRCTGNPSTWIIFTYSLKKEGFNSMLTFSLMGFLV